MLTIAAPSSTSCIRSRYWRRNAFQPGSFASSASLFGPDLRAAPLDLGAVSADGGVDVEARARVRGERACAPVWPATAGVALALGSGGSLGQRHRPPRPRPPPSR